MRQGFGKGLVKVWARVVQCRVYSLDKSSSKDLGKGLDKSLGWVWVRSEKGGERFGSVSGSVSFNICQ